MNTSQIADASTTIDLLRALTEQPGWELFIEALDTAVVADMNALATKPISDIPFIQGHIAGLRAAAATPGIMIEELKKEADRKRQQDEARHRQEYIERSQTPYA